MHRSERGVALLTVLLVAALATVIITQMLSRHHLSVAHTRQAMHSQQALAYALGAESWARHLLYRDHLEDDRTPPLDGLDDRWAEPKQPFEIREGALEIRIRDLEGLFNLNSIDNSPAGRERFGRLLAILELEPALVDLLADWIDADEEVRGLGAEDGAYLLAEPAYRTANAPMASVTELRLLANVSAEDYRRLAPYVTALPPAAEAININTAPPPVLAALAPAMEPVRAAGYARPETPWQFPGDLIGQEAGFAPEAGIMTTRSRLFESSIRVSYATQRLLLRSVIHRDPDTGITQVIAREIGGPASSEAEWAEPDWPFEGR